MMSRAMTWTLALCLLLPASGVGQQQDPALVGEGALVYSTSCGRCHNARPSTERTDAAWAVIVGHMRVRANLTKAQAQAVLAYLQATNLPEGATMDAGGATHTPAEGLLALSPRACTASLPCIALDRGFKRIARYPIRWAEAGPLWRPGG